MEYKFDLDFASRVVRAKVITQALFYIKRFEIDGSKLPNVILIGDINECFVFHSNDIIKYLDKDIDWNIAPSSAPEKNPDLVLEIAEDENLNPFVFVIDENFSFKSVVNKICELADNVQRFVHVTEHNISNIFDYFTSRVIKNVKKISANDIVAIFIGIITNDDNYYIHPKKSNIIISPFGDIAINADQYKSFISYFHRKYTPQEKMKFAEISDRLIEDTNRRNKGEFYTPTLFVDYAHKMISEALGDDWKDEYVVWDNCCGTKNLTRDYRFKELYCSTLENAELDISSRYNPEAISFQFDFLNDALEKLPKGLLEAFEQNKKIVFFLNPPYARNNGGKFMNCTSISVINNGVNKSMKIDNIGACSANLYASFLYRITQIKQLYNLSNCYIGVYCPTLFLTGPSFKKFRNIFLNNFEMIYANQFNAGHFANVAQDWAISFSLWGPGEEKDKNNFNYNCIDDIDGEIKIIKEKIVYNTDNLISASDWENTISKKYPREEMPVFSSALKYSNRIGKWCKNSIGFFWNKSNNVDKNWQSVALFTSVNSDSSTAHSILPETFDKSISFFAARKLIEKTWINSKDEYLAPNEDHPQFQEFVNDSIVYSLFNGSSNQSSLRNISYHDKLWDIKNEFFWMSKSEIEELANEHRNDECYSDVHTAPERFVYEKLQTIALSDEAQAVLDKASEIVRKTFKYRPLFDSEKPEYQINNWDCGFYQIKALAKEYAKDDLEEFKKLYKALADKMRPMVYALGFLK
ncbi:MAG: hypothetical protein J1F35_06615 [Erysipelotrichales bacterium]|nr:hypothetical protein [Erysipelotrichales bacterium]